MPVCFIDDPNDARIADYANVPEAQLLRERGLFVAEGRLVVRRLLATGLARGDGGLGGPVVRRSPLRTRSVLLTESAYAGLREMLGPLEDRLPIYVSDLSLMRTITGFNIHRGCLALGERPAARGVTDVTAAARRLVILEDVADADNVGGVFRCAAAFGADGVVLSPRCCDPLYRKAIRTSMGAALHLPFARLSSWPEGLRTLQSSGFTLAALTPRTDAVDIATVDPARFGRLALLVGQEGSGLSPAAEALAECRVRIPMAPDVDSLNVATAAGIAMHRLFAGR